MDGLNLDPNDNDASFLLDLMRTGAAEMVCLFHAIALFRIGFLRAPYVPPMQNFGVCIFFVLSGFLIAHTLVRKSAKPGYGFREYLIDRVARVYSGWIPALLFVAAVDAALIYFNVYDANREYDLQTFFGNFVMLQQYAGTFSEELKFRVFGSGGPFWTMAIEFHIYVLVGALFFMLRGNKSWLLLLVAIVFAQHPVATLYGSAPLFTLWLYGFAAAFILANYSSGLSTATWAIFGIFSAIFLYVNLAPAKDPFAPMNYIWVALGFTALVALALRTRWSVNRPKLRKAVRFMADYSFSLYLIHYTVLYAASKFLPPEHLRFALPAVVAANLIAMVIAKPTEMKHRELARWIKSKLPLRPDAAPGAAAGHIPVTEGSAAASSAART